MENFAVKVGWGKVPKLLLSLTAVTMRVGKCRKCKQVWLIHTNAVKSNELECGDCGGDIKLVESKPRRTWKGEKK
jgi:hypothetical protein